jgi:hypothetical protein
MRREKRYHGTWMVACLREDLAGPDEFSPQNQTTRGDLENGEFSIQTTKTRNFDEELQDLHGTTYWIAADSRMDDSER